MEKLKLLLKIFNKRYVFFIIDRERLPEIGDTITVGDLVAEFKKK